MSRLSYTPPAAERAPQIPHRLSKSADFSGFQVKDPQGVANNSTRASSKRSERSKVSKVSRKSLAMEADLGLLEVEQALERAEMEDRLNKEKREMEMKKMMLKQELEKRKLQRDYLSAPSRGMSVSSRSSVVSRVTTELEQVLKNIDISNWAANSRQEVARRGIEGHADVVTNHGLTPSDPLPTPAIETRIISTPVALPAKDKQLPPVGTLLNPQVEEFKPRRDSLEACRSSVPSSIDSKISADVLVQIGNVAQSLKEISQQNLLPQAKMSCFSGEVIDYSLFKHTFQWKVERNVDDPKERLNQLLHHLEGFPRELIQGCRFMEPVEGYADAWKTLDKEYGTAHKMEKAYMQKLLAWKRIDAKDVAGLKRFGAFLGTVRRAMGSNLRTLDAPHHIESIAKNLPPFLLGRWARKMSMKEEQFGVPVTFHELAEFVESEARVADVNARLFDSDKKATSSTSKSKVDISRKGHPATKSFSISADTSKSPEVTCKSCKGNNHDISRCKEFLGKSVKERWRWVSDRKVNVCFRCLNAYRLPNKDVCSCESPCTLCKGTHHWLLCDPSRSSKKKEVDTSARAKPGEETGGGKDTMTDASVTNKSDSPKRSPKTCAMLNSTPNDDKMLLAIAPARVRHKDGVTIETYAFLDPGSMTTLCAKNLADRLGAKGEKVDVTIRTQAGDHHCKEKISLSLSDVEGEETHKIRNVLVTENIAATIDDMVQHEWLQKWPHLADIQLPKLLTDAQVELIVGLNTKVCRTVLEYRNGCDDEPSGVKTPLGWVVHGPTGPEAEGTSVNFLRNSSNLTKQLEAHFNRDFPEREVDSKKEMSVEDKLFLDKVGKTIRFVDRQYEVCLPFKDNAKLPNNRDIANNRLKGLRRRFDRDKKYHQLYSKNVESLIEKGYAELVPTSELDRNDGRVWYLCHHGVHHPVKIDKLRVVYDCSCEYRGTSLNQKLLQGPDLTSTLNGVLLRFRDGQFAIAGDIEEMFHRVRVPKEDRDVLRFLWWPDGDLTIEPVEYRMTVHPFGATSSPSCVNFALQQTAKDNALRYEEEVVKSVSRNFYVDNYFKATNSEVSAILTAANMIGLCKDGGWRLNQWLSNDKNVLSSIPESERDKSVASLDLYKEDLPVERALGVHWCMESDNFTYKISLVERPVTRRGILSLVMSVYDPLGYASPFTLQAKLLMQELCKRKLEWDEHMSPSELNRWNKWLDDLPRLSEMFIPRSLVPKGFGAVVRYELHHFSDASQSGYGVVSYLRQINDKGQEHCTFLIGKSRVAPVKQVTIPRLELTAAAVAARMDRMLRAELDLPIAESIFWTDSTTVLKYLRNVSARFHTFVYNRVTLIRELSPVSAWRYVDTKSNPADLASRGATMDEFLGHAEWFRGPSFLWQGKKEWPTLPEDVIQSRLEGNPEVRACVAVCAARVEEVDIIDGLAKRVSTWPRLVRTITQCRRFMCLCRDRIAAKKANGELPSSTQKCVSRPLHLGCLSAEELAEAEVCIWKSVQNTLFAKEYENLKAAKPIPKKSPLIKLAPFIKDDLLRVGGRLSRAAIEYDSQHPIVLPRDSAVVKIYVRWQHEVMGHCGVDHLLTEIRNRFWIIKGRSLVRSITKTCVQCRKLNPRPMTQEMSDLPKDRVCAGEPPFTHVGTDCFGPFIVRKGRTDHKRYGLIITCLTSRAIHIEVLETMETNSFINGLRRFIARRGPVKSIRSDNGTNFVGAEKELRVELEKIQGDKVTDAMAKQGIDWKFNPPYASHFGGVWERLIRSTRRILRGLLLQQRLTDEVLVTLMCEVEAILNSRPLTAISDDPRDLQPLTPLHLLTLRSPEGPPCLTVEADIYSRKRWRQVQYLADVFWRRWVKEYLPTLQERSKWNAPQRNLRTGDLVLIADEKLARCDWLMGRVVKVDPDEFGKVRKAWIQTKHGEILRPLSKICMMLENDQ